MKELAIYVLITSAVWTYNIAQYRCSNTNIFIGKQRGGGEENFKSLWSFPFRVWLPN